MNEKPVVLDAEGNPIQANIEYVDLRTWKPEPTESDRAALARAEAKRERKLARRRELLRS